MSADCVDVVRAAVAKVMDLPLDVLIGSTPLDDLGVDSIARIVMVDVILEKEPNWQIPAAIIKHARTIAEFADGVIVGESNG